MSNLIKPFNKDVILMRLSLEDMGLIRGALESYRQDVVFKGNKEAIAEVFELIDSAIRKIQCKEYKFTPYEVEVMVAALEYLKLFASDAEKDLSSDNSLKLESKQIKSKSESLCKVLNDWLREVEI